MVVAASSMQDYSEHVQTAQRYVREHIQERLDRKVLAEVAGFSVPHFHRIFTAHTGESLAAYVRRVRLERAGRKLRMGAVDITEVALAAGYDSHAAFSKAFRAQYGLSPSEFRSLGCQAATKILHQGKRHEDQT
jgi:AraC family transcriptional regulator